MRNRASLVLPDLFPCLLVDMSLPTCWKHMGCQCGHPQPDRMTAIISFDGDVWTNVVVGPQPLSLPDDGADNVKDLTHPLDVEKESRRPLTPILPSADDLGRGDKERDFPLLRRPEDVAADRSQDIDAAKLSGHGIGELMQPFRGIMHFIEVRIHYGQIPSATGGRRC